MKITKRDDGTETVTLTFRELAVRIVVGAALAVPLMVYLRIKKELKDADL